MSQAQREQAVALLHGLPAGRTMVGPLLAEAIGADPQDLAELLAYPVALGLIRHYRVGAADHWTRDVGFREPDSSPPRRRVVAEKDSGGVDLDGCLRDRGVRD